MAYIVCLEEDQDRWIAHVPDLPGCYAAHPEREVAVQAVPEAVSVYLAWCQGHGLRITGLSGPMVVAEVIRTWEFEDGYLVNAFFAADRPPVMEEELKEYQLLLEATYKDLKGAVDGLGPEEDGQVLPGERWSIGGVLGHVVRADWWYLDRLGLAFSESDLPGDPRAGLDHIQAYMLERLPQLAKRVNVLTLAGETWSARKVLRRSLWHRRDHTQQILKLRRRLSGREARS